MSKRGTRGAKAARVAVVGAALLALGGIAYKLAPARAQDPTAVESTRKYTRNVAIVVYEGVELLDFAGPTEVFAAAAKEGSDREQPAFKVYTVATTRDPITSQGIVKVTPEYSIDDAPAPDIVVIPGGPSDVLVKNEKFMSWATSFVKDDKILLTVCTGAFVPAKAGLLDGLQTTTWYGAIGGLREAAPKAIVVDGRRFVDNGKIINTAGVSAGIDGALHTVARLLGREVADKTARYMEYHWTPEPYLAKGYSYLNPSLDERGRALQQASIYKDTNDNPAAEKAYRALIEQDPNDTFAWYELGYVLHVQGKLDDAIEANKRAAASAKMRANAHYNIACSYSLKGKPDDALDHLKQSVAAGLQNKRQIASDPDLANVRTSPQYQAWIGTI